VRIKAKQKVRKTLPLLSKDAGLRAADRRALRCNNRPKQLPGCILEQRALNSPQLLIDALTVHVKPQYGICRLQKREARLWR